MAEGRMLKKRISKSKKFADLKTHNARLLYLMIFPYLDIEGRLEAEPKLIKGVITPLLNFSLSKIREYLEDMHRVGLIRLYDLNDGLYLEYIRFKDFQRLRDDREAKSEIAPPGEGRELAGITPTQVKLSKDKLSLSKDNNILSQIENLLKQFTPNTQAQIKVYWERARAKNKSKVITDGRRLTMLNELYNSFQRCDNPDLFSSSLEAAISYDAPNIGYINAVIKNKKTQRPK